MAEINSERTPPPINNSQNPSGGNYEKMNLLSNESSFTNWLMQLGLYKAPLDCIHAWALLWWQLFLMA